MDGRHHVQPLMGKHSSGKTKSLSMREAKGSAMGSNSRMRDEDHLVDQDKASNKTSSSDSESEIESTSSEGSSSDDAEEYSSSGPDEIKTDQLKSRLAAFLPQLKSANQDLSKAGLIDDVDEDEQHIEMKLSLGVLEEKKDESIEYEDTSSDSDNTGDNENDEVPPFKKRKIEELA